MYRHRFHKTNNRFLSKIRLKMMKAVKGTERLEEGEAQIHPSTQSGQKWVDWGSTAYLGGEREDS